ncbi:MAG: hypothetical protein ACE5F9_05375 [Phycisphaerae bacterium]
MSKVAGALGRRIIQAPTFHSRFIGPVAIAMFCASGFLSTAVSDDHPPPAGSPAAALREQVKAQLAAGRVEAGLLVAQHALTDHPNDPSVRKEFVSLHVALARRMLLNEDFATANRALAAAREVAPDHPEVGRLIRAILRAQDIVPARLKQADRWLATEWFEPAFRAYRQALALVPERRERWTAQYLQAAIGAADDHYFTKNFHEAFYRYDAAVRIEQQADRRIPGDLIARWLQSLVHALSRDIDRVGYPPDYWKLILSRVHAADPDGQAHPTLGAMVRGLAYEDLGDLRRAAEAYGRVLGRPVVSLKPDLIRRGRSAALDRIRGLYDAKLSGRRRGIWQTAAGGPWQVLETPGFRIHHHNGEVAERVAAALRFHFDRIAIFLGRLPKRIPWSLPCDVYIHADVASFRRAIGQMGDVQAISLVRRRGDILDAHSIHALQTDPLLLSTSLAHELTHLMVGAATGYRPMAAALSEGVALQLEPACRHTQFRRLFAQQTAPRSLSRLLHRKELHPTDAVFYTGAHRLLDVLLARGKIEVILDQDTADANPAALARSFGFKSARALERAYKGAPVRRK